MAREGFDQQVYAVVALIPRGQLATYGQVAELIGAWGCARQVGWALRRLPLPSPIPWQRVVNARGCIAMSPGREGSDWMQRELLLAEGIAVGPDGRLPLARHRWRPDVVPWVGGLPVSQMGHTLAEWPEAPVDLPHCDPQGTDHPR
ncbi:MGMT family protein [Cyanobium sp. FGCU-52]|nr:MGMT family protein [Cyanobium sp. FGCU52]